MLAVAALRETGSEAAALEISRGGAEEIPHGDGTFDVVVTTQVLEYVSTYRVRWPRCTGS